jgi:putative transposase
MGRVKRVDVGGIIYHALNRANFRSRLFKRAAHYRDFLGILQESLRVVPMRLLAYCLMPNHWHLVVYPRNERPNKILGPWPLAAPRRYLAWVNQSQGKEETENIR